MSVRIITDSSANLRAIKDANYVPVPMSVTTDKINYRDDANLDVSVMLEDFASYKGKSGTACPGPGDWIDAFGDEKEILIITLTGTLSGAYNSAVNAADIHMQDNPDVNIKVIDSLTTGPELQMLAEKAAELSNEGKSLDEIYDAIIEYRNHTKLAFMLATLKNFAANGRVNKALAKSVELLHIKIVGHASAEGDLQPENKCQGEKRATGQMWENMKKAGFAGGKVRIRHTQNEELAKRLAVTIKHAYPDCDIKIAENRALCSYYAEPGSILVGYEL